MAMSNLEVWADRRIQQRREGTPRRSHSDGNRKRYCGKRKRRRPGRGAVNPANGKEFEGNKKQKQDACAGDGSGGGRQPNARLGKATERCPDQSDSCYEDEPLVRVWPAPCSP